MAHYGKPPAGRTGLYRLIGADGQLLYVGISCDPETRMKAHHGRAWWSQVESNRIEWHETRVAALVAERIAIREERPRYNVAETALHTRLAARSARPLDAEDWAQWDAADTSGVRRAVRRVREGRTAGVRAWAVKAGRISEGDAKP